MTKKAQGKNYRLISSLLLVVLVIPVFVVTAYAKEPGRYVGLFFISLLGMVGLYEVYTSMKVNKQLAAVMTLVIIPVIFLTWDDFRGIVNYFDTPDASTRRMKMALHHWGIYVITATVSFVPILVDTNYRKEARGLFVNQIILILVTMASALFVKIIWTITIESFWKFAFFVLIAIIADTFAYLGGMMFGKKWFNGAKLAPKLSPKKTWAGFVIGTFFAATFAILAGYFGNIWTSFGSGELVVSIVVGLLLALIAPFGDLAFSAIKRWAGVKDFSNLIPGHGGVFDRVDAMSAVVIFAAIIYVFA